MSVFVLWLVSREELHDAVFAPLIEEMAFLNIPRRSYQQTDIYLARINRVEKKLETLFFSIVV